MLGTVLAVSKTALIAVAVIHTIVAPGDTMSKIAVAHGDSLVAVEQVNPQVTDPNRIYAGEVLNLPADSASPSAVPAAPVTVPTPPPAASSGDSSSLADVPGVPTAFAACVAYRESTDLQNPAADGNAYGIIPASGYTVAGDSLAQQKVVFAEIYASAGPRAWDADGCPTHLGYDNDPSADESSNTGPWGP